MARWISSSTTPNNAKNLIIGHLNINSIRNKFLDFKGLVLGETDICLISETKLDDSFPDQQFNIMVTRCFAKIGISLGTD